ncbi:MAG: adenylosuccinate lyase [Candidatus Bipolaricaulis sp.]|nr:adenylosuccinate lyase [Candidatus Bipolaricaulis sp.]
MREISPLDGRYAEVVGHLSGYFSERALMQARCEVECRYILALDEVGVFPKLTRSERGRIESAGSLSDKDFARIKEIESTIRHDVKSCELFLRERLALAHPNRIHFALTSEDVNNLAYALLFSRYRVEQQVPQLRRLVAAIAERVERWKAAPFPARTHGQPASPTTFGKELAVFLHRLVRQGRQLEALRFRGKLSGSTGTYAAAATACPDVDWRTFSERFVAGLGLDPAACTTQIDDGDGLAEYFAITARINNVILDLDFDLWEYISRGDLIHRAATAEVGSSTMPHKVNPIRFENSEGNLAVSTALLHLLSDRLTHSRMQRDLSDSTVKRNVGVALAHSYLAVEETLGGLDRIDLDEVELRARIDGAPEVLAEAYQTLLRVAGQSDPYEALRSRVRGKSVTLAQLHDWIDGLAVDAELKSMMKRLRPSDYTGLAERLCDGATADAAAWLAR